ncbi:MAG TPA: DUF6152 family protein [Vicinamibacterales bacterium]|jgi:hypothetical protein|nr:DUF6152 family protein [Vicinamibacterales bacterium]
MNTISKAALAAFSLALLAVPAAAHHSLTAEFNPDTTVTMKGVMTSIEWINPHIYIYFDVVDKDGKKSQFAVETFPPNHMRSRYGLTKQVLSADFDKKEMMVVEVNPAKNGKAVGWLTKLTYPDGHFIKLTAEPGSPEAR